MTEEGAYVQRVEAFRIMIFMFSHCIKGDTAVLC